MEDTKHTCNFERKYNSVKCQPRSGFKFYDNFTTEDGFRKIKTCFGSLKHSHIFLLLSAFQNVLSYLCLKVKKGTQCVHVQSMGFQLTTFATLVQTHLDQVTVTDWPS